MRKIIVDMSIYKNFIHNMIGITLVVLEKNMPILNTLIERNMEACEYSENWEQNENLGSYAVANEFARLPQRMSVQAF